MRNLNNNETQLIGGGKTTAISALEGALTGAAITAPISLFGLLCAIGNGKVIKGGVYCSIGILVAGTLVGAIRGALSERSAVGTGDPIVPNIAI